MSKPAFIGQASGLPWAVRDGEVWDGSSYHRCYAISDTPVIKAYMPGKESGNVDASIPADSGGDYYYYKPAVDYNTYYPVSMSLYDISKCAWRVKKWKVTYSSTFTPHTGAPVTANDTTDLPALFSQPHQNTTPDESYLPNFLGFDAVNAADTYEVGLFQGSTNGGADTENYRNDTGPSYVKVGDLYYPRLFVYSFDAHSNNYNQKEKFTQTGHPDSYSGGDSVAAGLGIDSVTWTHSFDSATTTFTVTLSIIYTNGDDYEASWDIAPTEWWGYGGRFDTSTGDYLVF